MHVGTFAEGGRCNQAGGLGSRRTRHRTAVVLPSLGSQELIAGRARHLVARLPVISPPSQLRCRRGLHRRRRAAGCSDLRRRGLHRVAVRVVVLAAPPHRVEQDGELARDGDDGAFLRVPAAAPGEGESPGPQTTLLPEGSEHVMRRLHEEPAQERVAALGDWELLVRVARLVLPRHDPDVRADVAALLEARRVVDHQDEGERRELHVRQPVPRRDRAPCDHVDEDGELPARRPRADRDHAGVAARVAHAPRVGRAAPLNGGRAFMPLIS